VQSNVPGPASTGTPSSIAGFFRVKGTIAGAESEYGCWLAPVAVFAIVALGRALQIADGALDPQIADGVLDPRAIFWVTVAFVPVIAATVVPRPARFARIDGYLVPALALAGLVVQLGQLSTRVPGNHMRLEPGYELPLYWGFAVIGVAGGWIVWGAHRWATPLQIGALVAAHFSLGVWMISQSPSPFIDVYFFQKEAIAAFRDGVSPYGITFANIYGHSIFYGPGLSVDGRLQFGFPYFPLTLLLAVPGQMFGGDHRYAHLVAIELAAILMAFARPKSFGPIAALLFLTMPRGFYVLEQSWTEPFIVLGVAAVVFAACRDSRAVPWLFGAFVALKQYLVFALPAALLLVQWPLQRRDVMRLFVKAALLGSIVTLPFLLWSPGAFWRSVVTLQFDQPFRTDALSYLAWWAARGHEQPSGLISFAAAGLASAISVWRLPKTAAGFAATIAVTFFAFFVFNKQAFCNYYFFVVGALAVTLAAWRSPAAAR
jgi:hypothetical protein